MYLYRKLTVFRNGDYAFHILAADAARMWLDGQQIGQCLVNDTDAKTHSFSRIPVRLDATVRLSPGEHPILIKSTSRFSTHTLSFAIPPITQSFDEARSVPFVPVVDEQDRNETRTATDADAQRRLENFRFTLRLPPRYGPSRSGLDGKLDALPPTPGGAAYARGARTGRDLRLALDDTFADSLRGNTHRVNVVYFDEPDKRLDVLIGGQAKRL